MNFNVYLCQIICTAAFILTCTFILFPARHKVYEFLLYGYVAACCLILMPLWGQFGTPVMLLGSSFILLAFSPANRFYNLILFQAVWFWSLLTNYILAIPLSIAGYHFSAMKSSPAMDVLFACLHGILCALPAFFLGRRLRRSRLLSDGGIIPEKIQQLLLADVTICSCIFITNILRTQKQENLTEYMNQLENHYQEIRRYKHDYMNILSTINGYIQEGDLEKLKGYFELRLGSVNRLMFNNDATIAKLALIRVLEIKGLLYTKLIQAMNLNLNVSLELTQEFYSFPVNMLTLTRILGIFLDNAMEAAALTKERRFHIAILKKEQRIIFHIENSTLPPPRPLERLMEAGFTTKENHSGIGLSNVSMLLASLPELSHHMICENGIMKQILIIPSKEKTA